MKTKRFTASLLAVCILVMACSTTLASMVFAADEITRDAEIVVSSNVTSTGISLSGKSFDAYEVFTATLTNTLEPTASGSSEEGISYTVSEDFVFFFLQVLDTDENDATYTYGDYVYTIADGTISLAADSSIEAENVPANFDALAETLLTANRTFSDDAIEYVEDYEDDMAGLVEELRTYVLTPSNNVPICATTESDVIEISGVETVSTNTGDTLLGYYLVLDSADTLATRDQTDETVDTSSVIMAGALVTVPTRDTTGSGYLTNDATITIKGSAPTLTKEVWHNDKVNVTGDFSPIYDIDGSWDVVSDYQIGDTIEFRLTASIPNSLDGYEKYIYTITDIPEDGIDLNRDSIQIYTNSDLTGATTGDKHTLIKNDDGGFSLEFDMIEIKEMVGSSVTEFYIYYTATISETAIVALEYETNTASLTYSTNPYDYTETNTIESDVYVYTFDLDVFKTSGDTISPLAGATFALYELSVSGTGSKTQIYLERLTDASGTPVTQDEDGVAVPVYVITTKSGASDVITDEVASVGTITTDATGRFNIIGLDDATAYMLTEINAPDGYNAADPLSFTISASYTFSESTGEPSLALTTTNGSDITASGNVLSTTIVNTSSTLLPSTGGMGTTLLTYGGIILMIGAATVFFIKRKKM